MTFFNLAQTSLPMKEKLLQVETRLVGHQDCTVKLQSQKVTCISFWGVQCVQPVLGQKLSATTQLSRNGINWFFFQKILDGPYGG